MKEKNEKDILDDSTSLSDNEPAKIRKKYEYRTLTSALKELSDAFLKYQSTPKETRGSFNTLWLQRNCTNLSAWALRRNGGIQSLIDQSNEEVRNNFVRSYVEGRTIDSAVIEIREAHAKWKLLPELDRPLFNGVWLKNNFSNLHAWISSDGRRITNIIARAGGEVLVDYEKKKHIDRTSESVKNEIIAVHAKWELMPDNERGHFNANWLLANGQKGLTSWLDRNGGTEAFIVKMGGKISRDFEKSEYFRHKQMLLKISKQHPEDALIKDVAIKRLQAVYNIWKELPFINKEIFTSVFIQNHDSSLYKWMNQHGGIPFFIKEIGGDILKDFIVLRDSRRTDASIIKDLQVAYAAWQALPESSRGSFGFIHIPKGLYSWISKHGGIDKYVNLAGGSVLADFRIATRNRTKESAVEELRIAHAAWRALPESKRGDFSARWLIKNYLGLAAWMQKNGYAKFYVDLAGGDVADDFKIKSRKYSEETVLDYIRAAYIDWKKQPEKTRGVFNINHIKGTTGINVWIRGNGGINFFIEKIGGDVLKDFNKGCLLEAQIEHKKRGLISFVNGEKTDLNALVEYKKLLRIFGASRASDLLFKFRPEFKDLPIERVKSCLAEYLGDFLSAKQEFRIKDVGAAAEFLSETTLREGLFETMKEHCLQYYFEQRRQGAAGNSYEIIYNYLVHITNELHGVSNKFLDDVIEDVVSYFNSAIQEFKKPDKFVDRLTEDREFPDLNQRINMKELADKKRMLIADEMGLGKSASVIMAKEHLQLGCALVIVPKITERTWQDYLSDDVARKGYFKQGQAPRVLVVTSVADLVGVTKKDFDYIIISQAKLNGRYAMLLEELDPDMLIVDESHKFKNGKGVRTNVLLPLARKLEGSGKYLAMLTGTPIPNKVNDIAVALKLLYPDKFGDTPVGELATTIIRGDVIDLRSLLVPHMQMKELEDVVVMPKREQVSEGVTLSSTERDVYEALLELDEITAFEKMKALRTFLLNPELVGVEPGIRSSKFEALQNKLSETFKSKSKVLVVVNDYVSGIMRGKEFLFQQLCLPKDVSVEFIHGDDGSQSNENIRPDLQRRFNEGSEKMLLIVSGAAADVGISLVGAEETIIYNEPWTESDLKQQKARVFRQGLDHDITETTFIVKNSIEEGLHDYIAKKQKAIEKILKGIPISELEMRMVENAEKNKDGDVSEEDYEVNPELARHYFSVKHRLLLMFAHIKQRGEEEIRKFFETWGAEYAQGYREVGARSVQANANRVAGALMSEMITASGRHPAALQILDVASGPEMLRRHCADMLQPSITSLDINKHHFENGTLGKTFVGGWTAMPFKDRAFDYLNCAMAFQDSEFVPSKNKYERLDVLREMNRVLQPGGRVVINMIYSMEMNDMEKFRLFVEAIGFKIVTDFTGIAEFEDQYYSQVITLEKIADSEKKSEEVVAEIGIEHRVGLKMHKTKKTLRNDRKILKYGFYLNGKSKPILLNSADQKVSHEENMIEDEIAKLKKVYKTIREIPVQEIIDRGYVRISLSKKYYLFKRLITAPGIILIK